MRSKNKEIRRFLCGCCRQQGSYLVSVEGFKKTILTEPLLGSFSVRYHGLYYIMREYRLNGKAEPIHAWVEQRIFELGSPAILKNRLDDACSLRIPRFTNPVFYDMERRDKSLILRIYTARTVYAALTCKKALALFEQDLPEKLLPCEPMTRKEQREADRAARKEDKELRRSRGKSASGKEEGEKPAPEPEPPELEESENTDE